MFVICLSFGIKILCLYQVYYINFSLSFNSHFFLGFLWESFNNNVSKYVLTKFGTRDDQDFVIMQTSSFFMSKLFFLWSLGFCFYNETNSLKEKPDHSTKSWGKPHYKKIVIYVNINCSRLLALLLSFYRCSI